MKTEDLNNGSDSEDDADFDQVESNPPSSGKFPFLSVSLLPKLAKKFNLNLFGY